MQCPNDTKHCDVTNDINSSESGDVIRCCKKVTQRHKCLLFVCCDVHEIPGSIKQGSRDWSDELDKISDDFKTSLTFSLQIRRTFINSVETMSTHLTAGSYDEWIKQSADISCKCKLLHWISQTNITHSTLTNQPTLINTIFCNLLSWAYNNSAYLQFLYLTFNDFLECSVWGKQSSPDGMDVLDHDWNLPSQSVLVEIHL